MDCNIKREYSTAYAVVPVEALRDERLSLKSKGLYAYIMSLPEDWSLSVKGIKAMVKEGEKAIYSAFKELKEYGYVTTIQERGEDGRMNKVVYILHADKQDVSPLAQKRHAVKRHADKRHAEKDTQLNKDITKYYNKLNKDLTKNKKQLSDDNCMSVSAETDSQFTSSGDDFFVSFLDFFNSCMEGKVIPKIARITEQRKKRINARLREGYTYDDIKQVVRNAAESEFLNGYNSKGWNATFDWLFLPTNFVKVLEKNYENKDDNGTNGRYVAPEIRQRQEREQQERRLAAVMQQLAEEDGGGKLPDKEPIW